MTSISKEEILEELLFEAVTIILKVREDLHDEVSGETDSWMEGFLYKARINGIV